jgi:hypothetical protein
MRETEFKDVLYEALTLYTEDDLYYVEIKKTLKFEQDML